MELSLCVSWKAHIFVNILISNTHFGKIWSYAFESLKPRVITVAQNVLDCKIAFSMPIFICEQYHAQDSTFCKAK